MHTYFGATCETRKIAINFPTNSQDTIGQNPMLNTAAVKYIVESWAKREAEGESEKDKKREKG